MLYADISRLENLIANELSRRGRSRVDSVSENVGSTILAATLSDVRNNLVQMGKSP